MLFLVWLLPSTLIFNNDRTSTFLDVERKRILRSVEGRLEEDRKKSKGSGKKEERGQARVIHTDEIVNATGSCVHWVLHINDSKIDKDVIEKIVVNFLF